ncbi:hypothetical protein Cgig2_023745 [Carnegiea gigantea]|uniref:Uncharacterized protein n=1 Tax=Carnegiea gigantea TaxID=171969 RepID=A0A9Q1GLK5_9CARY|nr:hypothetical protein Cgig2_023745 [Carnegiea gigantea]
MEGKKYRDQLLYAEQELAAARGREQALQEKLLKEINDSQERLKRQIQECHELEARVKMYSVVFCIVLFSETIEAIDYSKMQRWWLIFRLCGSQVKLRKEENARKNVESTAASAEQKVLLLETKFKHLSGTAEREKKSLENEVKHFREDSKLSISRLRADLERVECQARNAEKESELLKEKLLEATDQLKKCLLEKAELEKKLTRFTSPKDTTSQSEILLKHLQEELRNYNMGGQESDLGKATLAGEERKLSICKSVDSEVRELRKLKASHENVELLKEKLVEEKGHRKRAEAELLKLREVQLSIEMLEDESSKKVMKDIPGVSSSDGDPVKFVALQKYALNFSKKIFCYVFNDDSLWEFVLVLFVIRMKKALKQREQYRRCSTPTPLSPGAGPRWPVKLRVPGVVIGDAPEILSFPARSVAVFRSPVTFLVAGISPEFRHLSFSGPDSHDFSLGAAVSSVQSPASWKPPLMPGSVRIRLRSGDGETVDRDDEN